MDRSRSFDRKANWGVDLRESVRAVVKHELGMSLCCCLYANVAKHGVRLPASKELDGVGADIGAWELSVEALRKN